MEKWAQEEEKLKRRIVEARKRLSEVEVTEEFYDRLVNLTSQLNLDGHRGDMVLLKACRAYCAFEGRKRAEMSDIKRLAPLALRHRLKRLPFEDPKKAEEKLYDLLTLL